MKLLCAYCEEDLEVKDAYYKAMRRRGQQDFYHKPCSRLKTRNFLRDSLRVYKEKRAARARTPRNCI